VGVFLFFYFNCYPIFLAFILAITINNTCAGFLAQCRRNLAFPDQILWTDEATFTPNGVFNSRNFVLWNEENPHAIRQTRFQYRWSINVWAGIIADRVVNSLVN